MRRLRIAPALACALLFGAAVAAFNPHSAEGAINLKVLTYNVWGLPRPLSEKPAERLKSFCDHLKNQIYNFYPWDVILLQEVWKPWMAEGLKNCGYPYSVRLDRGSFGTGLMILSRFPVSNAFQANFKAEPSWWDSLTTGESISDKGMLSATVEHPVLGPVFFVNTHLVANYGGGKKFEEVRRGQFTELAALMDQRARHLPRVLGGDLNVAPEGPQYTLLWEELMFLFPGYRRFKSLLPISTRSLTNPYSDAEEGHLDHLFGFNGAKPVMGSVMLDVPGEVFSDHYGWETLFEIQPVAEPEPEAASD